MKKGNNITEKLQKAYKDYFKCAVINQSKKWTPHVICNSCKATLHKWSAGNNVRFRFGQPMLGREPINHATDCYFCVTKVHQGRGIAVPKVDYADVPSTTKPIQHSENLPVPKCPDRRKKMNKRVSDISAASKESNSRDYVPDSNAKMNQEDLNDLVRDLFLSKKNSELMASRLRHHNALSLEVKTTTYRDRHKKFAQHFAKKTISVFAQTSMLFFENSVGLTMRVNDGFSSTAPISA